MQYNPRKAAQTIAYLAMKNGGNSLYVISAVKLVYLADRESLRRRGHPIQNEARVSMPHGPVNSVTLDYLNGAYDQDASGWSEFLTDRADNLVGLRSDKLSIDDLDELSDTEISILDKVWNDFGNMPRFKLCEWTHDAENVPEWDDPNGSSRIIPMDKMMSGVGLDNPIKRARELENHGHALNLLASL